ncbi:MAG TPA: leucine-rich repeat domain-containing protein [Verrucomicrobiae bacterium]
MKNHDIIWRSLIVGGAILALIGTGALAAGKWSALLLLEGGALLSILTGLTLHFRQRRSQLASNRSPHPKVTRSMLLLVGGLSLISPLTSPAQFTWQTNGNAITITGYTGTGGAVTIPNQITGLPVTALGYESFMSATNVTSVVLGTNVLTLGPLAFYGCSNLGNVALNTNLQVLGAWAFEDCTQLTNIVIGTNINFVGIAAFENCTSLTNIFVLTNNPYYSSVNGVLFNKTLDLLVAYPDGRTNTSYVMTNKVTQVADYAFAYAGHLKSITFSTNLTYLAPDACYLCTNLNNPVFPNSLTNIDYDAFAACNSLTDITIPNGVVSLAATAFADCPNLTNATISASVTNYHSGVFVDCYQLAAININATNPVYRSPGGVVYNQNLTTLIEYPAGRLGTYVVSNTVTGINPFSFWNCTNLTGITLSSNLLAIGNFAFSGCFSLLNVVIPNQVTSLGDDAFDSCGLTNILIGSSVTNLGANCFYGDDYLSSVRFSGSPPTASATPFQYAYNVTVLYPPWINGWGSTYNSRPTAIWVPYAPQPYLKSTGLLGGHDTFQIYWATNLAVVVETCTNLSNPVWRPLQTNALVNSQLSYLNPGLATNRATFYRVHSP